MEALVSTETGIVLSIQDDGFAWGTAESKTLWDISQENEAVPQQYKKPLAIIKVYGLSASEVIEFEQITINSDHLNPGDELTLTIPEWFSYGSI